MGICMGDVDEKERRKKWERKMRRKEGKKVGE